MEVTAEAAVLETQSASRGGIVTTQQVAEMPLNARNPFMLGAMMSGVTFNGAAIWQRPFDNGAIAAVVDERRPRFLRPNSCSTARRNNGQMGSNNIAYVPIVDAVQEFNVMTNMYNAEYGHTGGGIMNVVLKSGTNQHPRHGLRIHAPHVAGREHVPEQRDRASRNARLTISISTGSRWKVRCAFPKLLKKDGPVKLFYMGAFENYREGTPNPLIVSYPEAEMRNGDFSKLVNSPGQPITIYDPFTADYDANGNIVTPRQPFPGNIIPHEPHQSDRAGGHEVHAAAEPGGAGRIPLCEQQPARFPTTSTRTSSTT